MKAASTAFLLGAFVALSGSSALGQDRSVKDDRKWDLASAIKQENRYAEMSDTFHWPERFDAAVTLCRRKTDAACLRGLRALAEEGMPKAQFDLANTMERLGRDENGNSFSRQDIATLYISAAKHGESRALDRIIELAEAGEARLQFELVSFYNDGEYLNYNEARVRELLLGSASQGYGPAVAALQDKALSGDVYMQARLGDAYQHGFMGLTESPAKAFEWYLKAATGGNIHAQYEVSQAYLSGRGVLRSYQQGIVWLQKAVRQGDAFSQGQFGSFYLSKEMYGFRSSPQDTLRGYMWTLIASANGALDRSYIQVLTLKFTFAGHEDEEKLFENAQDAAERCRSSGYLDCHYEFE